MMIFIMKVAYRTNYTESNKHKILLNEANNVICGASNLLIGTP